MYNRPAQVAVTVGADQLVLLSAVDGFYPASPAHDPAARRFDVIDEITPEIEAMAGDATSGLAKGGLLYTSPSPRDRTRSRMAASA